MFNGYNFNMIKIFIIIIVSIVLIMGLGFLKNFHTFEQLLKKFDFIDMYSKKINLFIKDLTNNNVDKSNYSWLILNQAKMQDYSNDIVGVQYWEGYRVTKNYAIFINSLSKLSELSQMEYFGQKDDFNDYSRLLNGVVNNCISTTHLQIEKKRDLLKNPFILFQQGIQCLVLLPFSIFYWSGLMNYTSYNKIDENFITKIISLIFGMIGVFSGIMTIILGWEGFINLIKGWFT